VKGIEDIQACLEKSANGIEGVIAGRALYDGRLDLREALALASGKRA
ncbi:MAG: 1-(5-phosphoribosyl)-5-((5-phosphoribosylamino)methylideneamino)imidazole-4-carboxamide isomerase, partial [Candidatus Puniceispirillaceae bacterium]